VVAAQNVDSLAGDGYVKPQTQSVSTEFDQEAFPPRQRRQRFSANFLNIISSILY